MPTKTEVKHFICGDCGARVYGNVKRKKHETKTGHRVKQNLRAHNAHQKYKEHIGAQNTYLGRLEERVRQEETAWL